MSVVKLVFKLTFHCPAARLTVELDNLTACWPLLFNAAQVVTSSVVVVASRCTSHVVETAHIIIDPLLFIIYCLNQAVAYRTIEHTHRNKTDVKNWQSNQLTIKLQQCQINKRMYNCTVTCYIYIYTTRNVDTTIVRLLTSKSNSIVESDFIIRMLLHDSYWDTYYHSTISTVYLLSVKF